MNYEVYGIALLPIIVGIVQIIKQFKIPCRFTPIISIIVSEIISLFFLMNGDGDYKKAILIGLQMGLAATGLHSGFKTIANGYLSKNKH